MAVLVCDDRQFLFDSPSSQNFAPQVAKMDRFQMDFLIKFWKNEIFNIYIQRLDFIEGLFGDIHVLYCQQIYNWMSLY